MKKIIYILLGLALAAVVAIAALISLVDPNQFKPQLAEQVRKNTGRELVMEGDIGWRFWPSLGLSLEKVALRNPAGFAEPDLIRFEQGDASVALLPLLSHRLEIGAVTLNGAHLFIQTKADGSSNLSGLIKDAAAPSDKAAAQGGESPAPASDGQPWQIDLQGVVLEQASALVRDDRKGTVSRLDRLDLSLGKLTLGQWVPVTLAAKGSQGQLAFDLKGQGELKPARDTLASALKDLTLSGSLSEPGRRLDSFTLKADRLALGEWSSLSVSLNGGQGERDKPALTGALEGTLKARLDKNLKLVELSDAVLSANLKGDALPRPQMNLKLAGFARAELDKQRISLSKLVVSADEALLSGESVVQLGALPKIEFDLKGDKLDLDAWLGKATPAKTASAPATTAPAAPVAADKAAPAKVDQALSAVEPDLSALRQIDLAGRLQLGNLRVRGLDLSAVDLQLVLAGGRLDLKQFNAGVAGGRVSANGVIDARQQPVSYQAHKRVLGVNVRPLLQTLAQSDLLEGKGDLDVQVQGTGLSQLALRNQMQGKISLKMSDGALHGINLAEMIREARATLKGQRAEQVKEVRKTDFSDLSASFQIANGVASSDDIQLFAPTLRVKGQGQTALVPESLDFLFLTSIVESSKGQGGKTVDELNDVTIPVRIGGHWQAPSYRLDVKELLSSNKVLEDKARKEAERGLKKLLGDKADDEQIKGVADQLLKGLFK
ncbi:AsmA family protein [Aeromonas encheleia]|uniref:AsmA family protein n=1 Tax=Aeromonas encheleia TaxID=73010 RepID=A0AAE9MGZ4_9GAMM|nr:AsmA family protein [Aeromonas encheleia]USV57088.1 AsmA family protein [Aeromonas encheleia]